jgi:hypothetical protein
VLVAYVCNPSFSGGTDKEDLGLKPGWANSSARPYLEKKSSQKRADAVDQGLGLKFNPQY